jgi:RND superfamily putative drug exporter
MIFRFLGALTRRAWPVVLLAWVALFVASWYFSPPWDTVAQDKEFAFLPKNVPSRQAEEVFAKAFPDEHLESNIVLVLTRTDPANSLTEDRQFIRDVLEPALRKIAVEEGGLASEEPPPAADEPLFSDEPAAPPPKPKTRSIIDRIHTPNAPGLGALLLSPDHQAMLVVLELTTEFLSDANWPTITKVENLITRLKQEAKITNLDAKNGTVTVQMKDKDGKQITKTFHLTEDSRYLDLTGKVAALDVFTPGDQVLIVEEEGRIKEMMKSAKLPPGLTIDLTGSAVIGRDHTLAEGDSVRATELLTVVAVIVLLVLIYRAPLLALIPLLTIFLAVKTSIYLLSILAARGHITLFEGIQVYIIILSYGAGVDYCLFLIARDREEQAHGLNPTDALDKAVSSVGAALTASAATVMCGIAMMMFAQFGKFREAGFAIPFSLAVVLCGTLTFTPALLRLAGRWTCWPHCPGDRAWAHTRWIRKWFTRPAEFPLLWHRVGNLLVRRAGTIWLATVAVLAPLVVFAGFMYNRLSYNLIGTLPPNSPSVVGTRALEAHFPAGLMGPVTALLIDPRMDFGSSAGKDVVAQVTTRLLAEKEELGLADVRSLTEPLGTSVEHPFAGLDLPADVQREAANRLARERYTTDMGGRSRIGARLDLILAQGPFVQASVDDLERIRQALLAALPDDMARESKLYFLGPTASVRDLATVMQSDRQRIDILVVASVFIILLLLLRGLVTTVYLMLSVLFSYYATLGATFALFYLLDPAGFTGLDWKVAIFLFTILIAVGEDYNIFLMTRVHEEQKRLGPLHGITHALTRTGPIISSCGLIMAGTFASLLAGSLAEMKQLGFALAFGVLLDTYVVRPLLVPAFLVLFERFRSRWLTEAPVVREEELLHR